MLKKITKRMLCFSGVLGLTAGMLLAMGASVAKTDGLPWEKLPGLLGKGVLLGMVSMVCILLLFAAIPKIAEAMQECRVNRWLSAKAERHKRLYFPVLWGILFLAYVPAFLAYYPAVMAYDVTAQIDSAMLHQMTTHHPLLHTLYLAGVVQIGGTYGNYVPGMVLLSLSQMLIMSGIFAYAIAHTRRWGISELGRLLMLLFFALLPTHAILAVSTTKDVMFSGFVLLVLLKLYDMVYFGEAFFQKKMPSISFVICVILMLSLRNNALHALVVSLPFLYFLVKKQGKRILALCALGIFGYFALNQGLIAATGASAGSGAEALSVPIQQLVGTAVTHDDELLDLEEDELIYGKLPRRLYHYYDPHITDGIKEVFTESYEQYTTEEKLDFLKLWVQVGLEYPRTYVDIFLALTLGYWYPPDVNHANIYEGERQGYLLTDFHDIDSLGTKRPDSLWPSMERWYEQIATENVHQKIPVISLLFAPGTYTWALFFAIAYGLYRKRYGLVLPLVFLAAFFLTLLLGPTVLIRYAYPILVCTPFFLGIGCCAENKG